MKDFYLPRKIVEWLLEDRSVYFKYFHFEIVDEEYFKRIKHLKVEYAKGEGYYFKREIFIYDESDDEIKIVLFRRNLEEIVDEYSPKFILIFEDGEQESWNYIGHADLRVLVIDDSLRKNS